MLPVQDFNFFAQKQSDPKDLFDNLDCFGQIPYEIFSYIISFLNFAELKTLWNTHHKYVLEQFKIHPFLFTAFSLLDASSSLPSTWGLFKMALNTHQLVIKSLSLEGVKSIVSHKIDRNGNIKALQVLPQKTESALIKAAKAKGNEFTENALEIPNEHILARTIDNHLFYIRPQENEGKTLYWTDKDGVSQEFEFEERVVDVYFDPCKEPSSVTVFTETGMHFLSPSNTFTLICSLPICIDGTDHPRITKYLGNIGPYFFVDLNASGRTFPCLLLHRKKNNTFVACILSEMNRSLYKKKPVADSIQTVIAGDLICIYSQSFGFAVFEYKPDHREEIIPYLELFLKKLMISRTLFHGNFPSKSEKFKESVLYHAIRNKDESHESRYYTLQEIESICLQEKLLEVLSEEETPSLILGLLAEQLIKKWDELTQCDNKEFFLKICDENVDKNKPDTQDLCIKTLLEAFTIFAKEQDILLKNPSSLKQNLDDLKDKKSELLQYLRQRTYYTEKKRRVFFSLNLYHNDFIIKKERMNIIVEYFSIFENTEYPGKKWLLEDLKAMGLHIDKRNIWMKDFVRLPKEDFIEMPTPQNNFTKSPKVTCIALYSDQKFIYVHTKKNGRKGFESIRFYDHKNRLFTPLRLKESPCTVAALNPLDPMKCVIGKNLKLRFEAGLVMITSDKPLTYQALKGRGKNLDVISAPESVKACELIFDPLLEIRISTILREAIDKMKHSELEQEYEIIDFKAYIGDMDEPIRLAVMVKSGGRIEVFEFKYSICEDHYIIQEIKEEKVIISEFQEKIFHSQEIIKSEQIGVENDPLNLVVEKSDKENQSLLINLEDVKPYILGEKISSLTYSAIALTIAALTLPMITALALTPLAILQPGGAVVITGFSINISILSTLFVGGGGSIFFIAISSVTWAIDQQIKRIQRQSDKREIERINKELSESV
ncbi:MAG: hypothetical protein KDK55_06335 [Chlamydiia bacterium]|nr:hypothetical protein [Chlamydiia bacterium]